jgi:hypothetical protein
LEIIRARKVSDGRGVREFNVIQTQVSLESLGLENREINKWLRVEAAIQ